MKLNFLRGLLAACVLALPLAALQAQPAQPNPPAADDPVAGADVQRQPTPNDTNAERAKTQPGNNAPFWRGVKNSGNQPGYSSLPGVEKGVLIQPFVDYPGSTLTTAGEAWRQVRNQVIIPYGGALLLIVLLAIGIFYFTRGPIGGHHPDTGRKIERFTPLERATHWTVAISFAVLGISGIVMAFGKFFLLPIMGGVLFGWLTYALKTAHNFAGPLFVVGLLVMLVTYARDNLPRAADVAWLARAGGMLGGKEMPSHRFNGGEKLLFWGGVLVLGLVVSVSGLFLDQLVPGFLFTRGEMQVAHMVHGAASMVMMALFIGHIYMGTVGVKGAYGAMRTGYVDEAWAQDHHVLWAEDVRAGRIPAQRSGTSTPPPVATKHA
jgi:formate dehydrogenase subunit gamma